MEDLMFEKISEIGHKFWWQVGMNKISSNLIKKYLKKRPDLNILSAGCGVGLEIELLQKFGTVSGIDLSEKALSLCRQRGLKALKASVEEIPFSDNSFDLVTSFDVIYHADIKDEIKALKESYRVLKPGGYLVIRVPAYEWLRSKYDKEVQTKRRFTKKYLKTILSQSGFMVRKASYLNFFLFPLVLIKRYIFNSVSSPYSEVTVLPFGLNGIFKSILYFEAWLIKYVNLPFGLSVICVAQKSNE